jgi:hypothetical protein
MFVFKDAEAAPQPAPSSAPRQKGVAERSFGVRHPNANQNQERVGPRKFGAQVGQKAKSSSKPRKSKERGLWDLEVEKTHNKGTDLVEPLTGLTDMTANDLLALATAVPRLNEVQVPDFDISCDFAAADLPTFDDGGFEAEQDYDKIFGDL